MFGFQPIPLKECSELPAWLFDPYIYTSWSGVYLSYEERSYPSTIDLYDCVQYSGDYSDLNFAIHYNYYSNNPSLFISGGHYLHDDGLHGTLCWTDPYETGRIITYTDHLIVYNCGIEVTGTMNLEYAFCPRAMWDSDPITFYATTGQTISFDMNDYVTPAICTDFYYYDGGNFEQSGSHVNTSFSILGTGYGSATVSNRCQDPDYSGGPTETVQFLFIIT